MITRTATIAAVVCAAFVTAGAGSGAATKGPCGAYARRPAPAHLAHVVWIWFENHGYSDIAGSTDAPYLNAIAGSCGLATNYQSVAHPSLPNYIAATSGSTQGIEDDGLPPSHTLTVPSIFSQVDSRSFEQAMPENCDLSDTDIYAVRHNPEVYYLPLRQACRANNVPLGRFNARRLPQFSFVTPDMCSDMHSCSVADGDSWLRGFLPRIIASPDYRAGRTVVFITFDESEQSDDNKVFTAVLSEWTPAGKRVATSLSHYSLLRTTEELLGVNLLGSAQTAASMRRPFHL